MKYLINFVLKFRNSIFWKIWALIIMLLSLLPSGAIKPFSITDIVGIDKIGHFVFYAVLVFLYLLSSKKLENFNINKIGDYKVLFVAVLFSFLIELTQSSKFLGRNFDILDLIANIAGSIMGVIIYNYFLKNKRLVYD